MTTMDAVSEAGKQGLHDRASPAHGAGCWQRRAIVAFASLWLGAGKDELSIDLMRHLPSAANGKQAGRPHKPGR